ncbi:hypothetical protein MIS46_08570 [Wielerella bovis]|uniref:hypothetical protein n=1 Tax=Wielerella bovis TaxID=2917790 RepID=UPI002018789A|nr:hypothetical protein [Wielerella bovis]ULJ62032.1 hypothetical protein MIS46_08570 [Wielerella bovis]
MKIRFQATLAATILTSLAACSSTPYNYWHKPNVTQAQTTQVLHFCKEDVGADIDKEIKIRYTTK